MTHDPAQSQPPPDPLHPGSGPMHVQRSPVAPGAARPDDDVPRQPHERDQSLDATAAKPDPRMVQAKKDLDAGQMDTDMRVQPGLDAERRRAAVGGPAGQENPPRERLPREEDLQPPNQNPAPPGSDGGTRTPAGSNYGDWVPDRSDRLHPDIEHPQGQPLSPPKDPGR
jgi:hypothetical protein